MAPGRKTGGRNFIKGQPGGPGRPQYPEELNRAKMLNKVKVLEILNRFISMPIQDVVAFAQNKTNPAMEVLVASIIVHAIKVGDHSRLNFLLDRTVGRVKEEHEHTFAGNLNSAIVDKIEEIKKNNSKGGSDNGEESKKENVQKAREEIKGDDDLPW